MQRVVITQPSYLPWIGYFDQIAKADTFVFLDTVQFTRRDWRTRNKIKLASGDWSWLQVPVSVKGHREVIIKDVLIDYSQKWVEKHLRTLEFNYKKAPHFQEVYLLISEVLLMQLHKLSDLNIKLIEKIVTYMGITKPNFLRSSELSTISSDPTERLVKICSNLNATHYLSSESAKSYLNEKKFTDRSINLEYHAYVHPTYPQLWGDFVPYVSIIDLLFNVGKNAKSYFANNVIFEKNKKVRLAMKGVASAQV